MYHQSGSVSGGPLARCASRCYIAEQTDFLPRGSCKYQFTGPSTIDSAPDSVY